jgi:hypothetical protein
VTRNHPAMVPFLKKGMHQTPEMRPKRGRVLEQIIRPASHPVGKSTATSKIVKAFQDAGDMEAQGICFISEPPKRKAVSAVVIEVFYGFGDARRRLLHEFQSMERFTGTDTGDETRRIAPTTGIEESGWTD